MILDDGIYYIERDANTPEHIGNGFLHRRCTTTLTSPGYEVIGQYFYKGVGTWHVVIDQAYNAESNSDLLFLGKFTNQTEAITSLWQHRKQAYFHQDGMTRTTDS